MKLESREWINSHGVKILEGVSEVHYSASGGEIPVHGKLSYLCKNLNAFELDTKEQERIMAKRQAKQQATYGYVVSDVFWVNCLYNIYPNVKYGNSVSLPEFFSENGISDLKAVTPRMLINWPHTEWGWSMERDPNVSEEDIQLMF